MRLKPILAILVIMILILNIILYVTNIISVFVFWVVLLTGAIIAFSTKKNDRPSKRKA